MHLSGRYPDRNKEKRVVSVNMKSLLELFALEVPNGEI